MKEYVIYMVLLSFLLFNIYVLVVGRKRRAMSASDVQRQKTELAKTALEEQKKYGIRFTAHSTYMNDKGKVLLAAIDPEKRVLGLFFGNDVRIIPFKDLCGAQVVSDEDDKSVYAISVEITRKSGCVISYPFSTAKRRKRGWISKFIKKDSGEFAMEINSLLGS